MWRGNETDKCVLVANCANSQIRITSFSLGVKFDPKTLSVKKDINPMLVYICIEKPNETVDI